MSYNVLIVSGYGLRMRGMRAIIQGSEMPPQAIYEADSPDTAFSELERIAREGSGATVIVTEHSFPNTMERGISLLKRIKADKRYAKIPVIVVSGPDPSVGRLKDLSERFYEAIRANMKREGAFDYLLGDVGQNLANVVKDALKGQTQQ